MKKTLSKSKLIGKGSYGCVFRPGIYCKNKKKKINNKTISKIMIKNTQKAIKKEFKIDKLIKKIPNHNQWSYIWTKMCKPPDYDKMKEISEIQKCLKKSDKTKEEYNNGRPSLFTSISPSSSIISPTLFPSTSYTPICESISSPTTT